MRLRDFDRMVQTMVREIPGEFLRDVTEVTVSRAARPHPSREGVFTLGECETIAVGNVAVEGAGGEVPARIILYHGSFEALARGRGNFDWEAEAWETLTHEIRHHLEWNAGEARLEEFDMAAEENFARHDGEGRDPAFFLGGEPVGEGAWRIDDDVFLDHVVRRVPRSARFHWAGATWTMPLPEGTRLPAWVSVQGVDDPPPGELVLVFRRRPGWRDLLFPPSITRLTGKARRVRGP